MCVRLGRRCDVVRERDQVILFTHTHSPRCRDCAAQKQSPQLILAPAIFGIKTSQKSAAWASGYRGRTKTDGSQSAALVTGGRWRRRGGGTTDTTRRVEGVEQFDAAANGTRQESRNAPWRDGDSKPFGRLEAEVMRREVSEIEWLACAWAEIE